MYRRNFASERNRRGIPNRVDIDERLEVANKRERIGDWKADTIIRKNYRGVIATIDERKPKVRLAQPLPGKKAQEVTGVIVQLLKPIEHFAKTITFDNGKELTQHEQIAQLLIAIHTLQSPIIHGSGDKMRMLIAYYDSIFQRR